MGRAYSTHGKEWNAYLIFVSQKKRDHWEYQDVCGWWIILKWMAMVMIDLIQDRLLL
jgi:hypothetical protein